MKIYRNLGGDSGVSGFQSGEDYIVVFFKGGSSYLYNYDCTGIHNVEQMKSLADQGNGLNSFINKYVRKNYARKLA